MLPWKERLLHSTVVGFGGFMRAPIVLALLMALVLLLTGPAMARHALWHQPHAIYGNPYHPDALNNPYPGYRSPDSTNTPYGRYGTPDSPYSIYDPSGRYGNPSRPSDPYGSYGNSEISPDRMPLAPPRLDDKPYPAAKRKSR